MCVWIFFFKKKRNQTSFWRPKIRTEFLSCDWDNTGERVVYQEGFVLGMIPGDRAGHHICFQHDTTASFLTCSRLLDFFWQNPGVALLTLLLLVPGGESPPQGKVTFPPGTASGKYCDTRNKYHFCLSHELLPILTVSVWDAREFK